MKTRWLGMGAGVLLLLAGLAPASGEKAVTGLARGTGAPVVAQAPTKGGEIVRLPYESDMGYELRKMGERQPGKPSGELGGKDRPIRCAEPRGEQQYLARLRDASGKSVQFRRRGSMGVGVYGHILDLYEIRASDGQRGEVYMDMYYTRLVDEKAIPGFTLAPAP